MFQLWFKLNKRE